ncbi:TolC family protein [Hymenobacter properus]|uniref:TolC family protein n=1 Tax=Hymenobacter properus TaxID=2791026 RepID=A0A931BD24_9BACT|nr:TolC family protein [Hymenobacter properus]MBF9140361.1 TolC family protein [Hymenobacter properus]MBR7719168.1 TolC family protein [Microvirga sp. SRT04]
MDKKRKMLLVLCLVARAALGQPAVPPASGPVLTLAHCYDLAQVQAPLRKQIALNNAQAANNTARLATQLRLPQLAINGQASYQSEVTKIPLEGPGINIPTLSKDQYRLTLDASQTLFDGGTTRRQQELETLASQVNNQQVEVNLFRLREQVNGLYFGALLSEETARLRQGLRADLLQRRKALLARRANGVATGQDVARLDAEVLNLDQQLRELATTRAGLLRQLGELLGQALSPDTRLTTPTELPPAAPRPELSLYAQQKALLTGQQQLSDARLAPRLSAFGQVGYGRPTLNFLRNDFHGYGLAGLRLNWNLSNYYTRRQDREAIRLGQEAVAVQQTNFEQSQRVALAGQQTAVERYQTLLATDAELIALREKIQATAAVQLDNGIIGFSDYFTEANNLSLARLNQQLHLLQLLQAQADYSLILGASSRPR